MGLPAASKGGPRGACDTMRETTLNPADVHTEAAIQERARELAAEAARSEGGAASVTLESYPGHATMLSVRVKDGGAEVHAAMNDLFIVQAGEATLLIGGTVVGAEEIAPGEVRGSHVEGATPHPLKTGDIAHIAPGVPHQLMVPEGSVFVYYVVKVAAPR